MPGHPFAINSVSASFSDSSSKVIGTQTLKRLMYKRLVVSYESVGIVEGSKNQGNIYGNTLRASKIAEKAQFKYKLFLQMSICF